MGTSFLSSASKRVTDVRSFLRDAAGGSSIKYAAEKGARHMVYIPYVTATETDENGNTRTVKQLVAISGNIHEWQTPDGKYKATICLKDVTRNADDGTVLNDGSCPFCDRVPDAWDIYRYRKEREEAQCKLTGEDRKKHLEKSNATFADERKAKDARSYMYILIVKFRQQSDNSIILGQDNLPEYDLKVMKLSQSRVDKIQQQVINSGADLPGAELMFEYPATDDRRLQISQSTTALVFPNNMMTAKYPALLDKINEDVKKFQWEGIEKSFPEWAGMTTMEAKKITDNLFEQWDKYCQELKINAGAQYMEYVTSTPVTNPQLGGNVVPGVPGVPNVPGAAAPGVPGVPGGAPGVPGGAPTGAEAPNIPPIPDANAMFGGASGGIQI